MISKAFPALSGGAALKADLSKLTARDRATIVPIAPWELRVGRFGVYYEAGEGPPPVVTVRAIGMKVGNRVRIGNQWWELSKPGEGHEDPGDDGSHG